MLIDLLYYKSNNSFVDMFLMKFITTVLDSNIDKRKCRQLVHRLEAVLRWQGKCLVEGGV